MGPIQGVLRLGRNANAYVTYGMNVPLRPQEHYEKEWSGHGGRTVLH